jgi:hypothetical protein
LRVEDWTETREALHLFTQVVGKVKLEKTPLVNHWWNVTFVVSPRGLTSGAVPDGTRLFQMDFDFIDSQLQITSVDGGWAEVALRPMSVADFYAETLQALADLGIQVNIHPMPNELPEVVPFDEDRRLREYRPEQARAFWLQLVQAHRVLSQFRAGFVGKVSPVHFFWGSFDLAVTRFSGHPAPNGFAGQPVRPSQAFYSADFRQFLLPYEAVRAAEDPDGTLLSFLEDTYAAVATLAEWDPSLATAPRVPASTSRRGRG